MRRSLTALSVLVVALGGAAGAAERWVSPAPDVVVYTTPALAAGVGAAAAAYRGRTGIPVRVFVDTPQGTVELIAHRARADVVVADPATVQSLTARNLVTPGSVVVLGPAISAGATVAGQSGNSGSLLASLAGLRLAP